jgi:S1-C subfamily serine protease
VAARPLVAYLTAASPAAQAGVRPGDLLLAVGPERVETVREAGARLLAAAPGGPPVVLTLGRGDGERQVSVQPVARPERVLLDPIDEIQESLEVSLQEVGTGPGSQQGLVVVDLVRGGRGEKGRFRKGDVIVSVDDKPVKTFQAFDDLIRKKFRTIFAGTATSDRKFASSYVVTLEVRAEGKTKVTRDYVNLFPDFLAPPVY